MRKCLRALQVALRTKPALLSSSHLQYEIVTWKDARWGKRLRGVSWVMVAWHKETLNVKCREVAKTGYMLCQRLVLWANLIG